MSHLRKLTMEGALRRYGPRNSNRQAYEQIEHELKMIEELGFPAIPRRLRHRQVRRDNRI